MLSSDPAFGFWGKSDRTNPSRTHPLLAHSADVAAVMEGLLNLSVYRRVYAAITGKVLDETTVARLSVIAGLHDVGKNTAGFQAKNTSARKTNGHIRPMGALCNSQFQDKFFDIFPWLLKWGDPVFDFLTCMCGHHGSFPMIIEEASVSDVTAHQCSNLWDSSLPSGLSSLDGLRTFSKYFPQWFPRAFVSKAAELPDLPPTHHLFAGLLMIADWVGSDEQFFPYATTDFNPSDYIDTARARAVEALKTMRLDISPLRSKVQFPGTFLEEFGMDPLPTQDLFESIPLSSKGSLVIVEAETGSGKTECALRHFIRLFESGEVDSLYLANPLRFAATQLQKRVSSHMRKIFGEEEMPTVLAVPGYLMVDNRAGIKLPAFSVQWPDTIDPRRNWAAEHPKRYLCAPSAVGTIDQALLAVLKAPHSHLRAAALCRSLLVIDEVHASDTFMARITESLVELFATCGGHVLMMSATLGGAARQRYMQIFKSNNQFAPCTIPDLGTCLKTPYPLISSTTLPNDLTASTGKTKSVSMKLKPHITTPEIFVPFALDAANEGACVLILRNSVSAAVNTMKALEKQCGKDCSKLFTLNGIPTLHHARFSPADRKLLDDEVEAIFGKQGIKRRPNIIVTTQTLEQSLDVDFDFLITDLCPADILLQRMGRLFRHQRERPKKFREPVCFVLLPPDPAEKLWLLSAEARRYQFGRERAYEDVRSVAATWQLLEEVISKSGMLHIPEMNRELVEYATHPAALSLLAEKLGPEWVEITASIAGIKGAKRQQAAYDIVSWQKGYSVENVAAPDETTIVTRLGLNDAIVHFDPAPLGPFSRPVDRITVPGWMLQGKDLSELDSQIRADETEGGFSFSACGATFSYDRYGLERS